MITTSNIDQYRTTADTASANAASFNKGGTVETELLDALNAKLATNKPLIEGKNEAMAQYLKSPVEAKAQYSDPTSQHYVFNPYQRESLISNAQSMAYQPYATLSDYLGLAMGNVQNLAKQGLGAYQNESTNRTNQAALAQDQYKTALNEYMQMQNLALEKQKLGASSAKEKYLNDILSSLGLGNGNEVMQSKMTEQQPMYSPTKGEGSTSAGGEWKYSDGNWVPNQGTTSNQQNQLDKALMAGVLSGALSSTDANFVKSLINPQMDDNTKKRQSILQQANSVFNTIAGEALTSNSGLGGWLQSNLGRLPGISGGGAESLRRDTEGFAKLIASAFAGEVGVATDKDVNRWMNLMPRDGDTMNERIDRMQKLIKTVESEARAKGIPSPIQLMVQDPNTGDIYQADDFNEYQGLLNEGYQPS